MFPELVQVTENWIQQLTMESPEPLNMVASTQDNGVAQVSKTDLQEVDNAHEQMVLKSTRLKAGMSSTEPRETRLATNFWESVDTSRSEQVAKPLV